MRSCLDPLKLTTAYCKPVHQLINNTSFYLLMKSYKVFGFTLDSYKINKWFTILFIKVELLLCLIFLE